MTSTTEWPNLTIIHLSNPTMQHVIEKHTIKNRGQVLVKANKYESIKNQVVACCTGINGSMGFNRVPINTQHTDFLDISHVNDVLCSFCFVINRGCWHQTEQYHYPWEGHQRSSVTYICLMFNIIRHTWTVHHSACRNLMSDWSDSHFWSCRIIK